MLNEALYSSDKMDWATPQYLFDALNAEFDFTLDACASASNAKCAKFITEEENALNLEWEGRVFMNPPYGRAIKDWMSKARHQVENGLSELVVCLVPVRSDSRWWHEHSMKSSEIRLLDQRIEFIGSTNKAPFPVAIVVFRRAGAAHPVLSTLAVRPLRGQP